MLPGQVSVSSFDTLFKFFSFQVWNTVAYLIFKMLWKIIALLFWKGNWDPENPSNLFKVTTSQDHNPGLQLVGEVSTLSSPTTPPSQGDLRKGTVYSVCFMLWQELETPGPALAYNKWCHLAWWSGCLLPSCSLWHQMDECLEIQNLQVYEPPLPKLSLSTAQVR